MIGKKNYFLLLIAFFLLLTSCEREVSDDTQPPCLPFNIVGKWSLREYFHFPENSSYSYLYTTFPGTGGYYYPTSTIIGDLHILDEKNFTLDLQLVFKRDSLPLLKINKNLAGAYFETHVDEPPRYKGNITFISSDEELDFLFLFLCQVEGLPIKLQGFVEGQEVDMGFYPD
ncbi:MAG: hypothetical protein WA004_00045 [Saprospiraceae bacterium]